MISSSREIGPSLFQHSLDVRIKRVTSHSFLEESKSIQPERGRQNQSTPTCWDCYQSWRRTKQHLAAAAKSKSTVQRDISLVQPLVSMIQFNNIVKLWTLKKPLKQYSTTLSSTERYFQCPWQLKKRLRLQRKDLSLRTKLKVKNLEAPWHSTTILEVPSLTSAKATPALTK